MIKSIRHFLLISLLISITIASSITAIGNYLLNEEVIQPYLDNQLKKIFSFVELIDQTAKTDTDARKEITTLLSNPEAISKNNLFFQIWNQQGKLTLASDHHPQISLQAAPLGFSYIQIDDQKWRVYAGQTVSSKNKIVVAELHTFRNKLADDITRNNAYILLITYPVFVILIWIIVGLALRSITRVTNEISNRAPTYLEPVDASQIPVEIMPLVNELNQLFERLKLAFDRNKQFAADAAHELRTPLAALKTQAQVALRAENEIERDHALLKVIESVDRSSHVVTQLLTLSRLSQEEALQDVNPVDLHRLAAEIIAYLVPLALEKNIEIDLAPPPALTIISGNEIALGILIRNIVENAIRYTPADGQIHIRIANHDRQVILQVIDTGPGIPIELRERVFERFYRIIGTIAPGSGLGLAIVSFIADLHHAQISLSSPPSGIGLQFDVSFPASTEE